MPRNTKASESPFVGTRETGFAGPPGAARAYFKGR
jgi:hypothetical protein